MTATPDIRLDPAVPVVAREGALGASPASRGRSARLMPALRFGLAAHAAGALVLGLVALAMAATGRPATFFTREPAWALQSTDCSGASCSYLGALSNLGVLLWCATASMLILAASMSGGRERRFLGFAAAVTAMLGLDDLAMLHEQAERGSLVVYAVAGIAFIVVFRRELMRLRLAPLIPVAAFWFSISIAMDHRWANHHFFEDGAKFLGICLWTAVFVAAARGALRRRTALPS